MPSHLPSSARLLVAALAIAAVSTTLHSQQKPAPPKPAPAAPKPAAKPAPTPAKPAATPPAKAAPAPAPVAKAPAPPPPPPDVTVASTYVTNGKEMNSTVSLKGQRARLEYGNEIVTLQYCDLKRVTQLNTTTKTYLSASVAEPPAVPPPTPKTKGGQIIYTTTVTDTGETKPMFGFTARHLKTVTAKDATTNSCDKRAEKVETDGWYVDLPEGTMCTRDPSPPAVVQVDPEQTDCRDEIKYVNDSKVTPGYPVSYTMTSVRGDAAPVTTTMTVSDVKRSVLGADLFDVPDGYLEVKSFNQLTANHRPGEVGPKVAGVTRIGVAPVANKTDQQVSVDVMTEALAESFGETKLDVVMLKGTTLADLAADAKAKEVDYILQNSVSELKRPGGGVLGKIAGSNAEELAAKVDYSVTVPGQTKAAFSDSQKSGTSTLKTAIGAATKVAKIVAPMLMMQYTMMNSFAPMQAGMSPGAGGATSDPVMDSLFSMLDRATAPKPGNSYTTEDSAVAAAMEKEIEAVVSELQKRSTQKK